jgi:hypothetical protein
MPSDPGPPGREQVPDAVPDDHGVPRLHPEQRSGGQETVGVGLGVADYVAGHHRGVLGQAQQGQRVPGGRPVPAGGDGPRHGLKRRRSARIIAAGHAFVQNLRRGHYELATDIPARHRVQAAFDQLTTAI